MSKNMDTIKPGVVVNGRTIYPKGYVFILGFAIGGCQWAIDIADTEEFRQIIRDDLIKESNEKIESLINLYEKKIIKLKDGLK